MKQTIYALCIFLLTTQAAHALIYGTPEGSFAREVAMLIEAYVQEHDGSLPTSWNDFEPYLRVTIDERYHSVSPTKRYAFISQRPALPPPYEGAELLMITRRPFREIHRELGFFGGGTKRGLREPGRYIIYRHRTGEFRASWVAETYVQEAFRGSEFLLPIPDTEPERPHEREIREGRRRSMVTWTLVALVAAVVFAVYSFARRRRFSKMPSSA